MTIFKRTIAVLGLVTCTAFAKDVSVQSTGSGLTKEVAIEAALTQAIRQVKGVDIDSQSVRKSSQIKVNGEKVSGVAVDSITAMQTSGQVKSYQILEEHCDTECQVTLQVVIPVYSSPGLSVDKRRKLAVAPFSGEYGWEFSQNLQAALVQSRRFAVLDRQHSEEYEREKALLLSGDTALGEKMRLGQVLGLDYLIVGEVTHFDNSREERVSLTGETEFIEDMGTEVSYKVINLATRQVKWQDTSHTDYMPYTNESARKVAIEITSAIYPLKIVSNNASSIVLNQGGKNIERGGLYDVFKLGKKLIDPYSHESLGREEIYVGQIEVVKVTTKTSYAHVVDGDYKAMKVGSIARPSGMRELDEIADEPSQAQSTVETPSSGGVVLPTVPHKVVTPEGGGVILPH